MSNFKRTLGFIAILTIMAGVFCANEADAGGRNSPTTFPPTTS